MFSFILSLLAGGFFPFAQERLVNFVTGVLKWNISLDDKELTIVTLLAVMGAVTVLVALSGSHAHALPIILGTGIGVFGKRILNYIQSQKD